MATADSVERTFECPICYETFTNARMLPCGHSLCGPPRKCFSNILEGSHLCPIDRTDMHKNGGKEIKDFPVNYAIQSAIEASRPTTSADKNYESCDVHGQANKLFCEDCETMLCELCWEAHHSEHRVILFKKHLERIQKQLESEVNITMKEGKIDNIIEDCEELTAKWLAGKDLLSNIKDLFKERNESVTEMTSSTSCSEVMEKMSRFKKANENMNKLKLQFEEKCEVVMSELGEVLSKMKGSTTTLTDTVRKESIQEIETKQSTTEFTTKVSPVWEFPYCDHILSIAVDSDSNIYMAHENNAYEFVIIKMKATLNTNISLDVIQQRQIKVKLDSLKLAIASDKLYGLFESFNSEEIKLCELDKDTFQTINTLNTERVSTESLQELSIEGKGSLLVLLFYYTEVKDKKIKWIGKGKTQRRNEVHLHVYDKDILVNTVKSEPLSIPSSSRFSSASVGRYLILCWRNNNNLLMTYFCIEWNQLKRLKTIPEFAVWSMEWIYDRFPMFFLLGNEVHAIVQKKHFFSATKVRIFETFSNVIRHWRIKLYDDSENQRNLEISHENVKKLYMRAVFTVSDNSFTVLCSSFDSGTNGFFLVKFENGRSQRQK